MAFYNLTRLFKKPEITKSLELVEYFVAPQGEGNFLGKNSLFIRLAKCNKSKLINCSKEDKGRYFNQPEKLEEVKKLDKVEFHSEVCKWCINGSQYGCDEGLHSRKIFWKTFTHKDLVNLIEVYKKLGVKHIIFTGGEPSLNNLNPILEEIYKLGLSSQVETNGYNISNLRNANWVTFSPKEFKDVEKVFSNKDSKIVKEIKIPYPSNFSDNVISYLERINFNGIVFLTPINATKELDIKNNKDTLNKVTNYNGSLDLRINIQAHKVWNCR